MNIEVYKSLPPQWQIVIDLLLEIKAELKKINRDLGD